MLKATATNDGKPVLILGLSNNDLAQLMAAELIAFDAAELGFAGEIIILAAEDENAIEELLTKAAGHSPIRVRGRDPLETPDESSDSL